MTALSGSATAAENCTLWRMLSGGIMARHAGVSPAPPAPVVPAVPVPPAVPVATPASAGPVVPAAPLPPAAPAAPLVPAPPVVPAVAPSPAAPVDPAVAPPVPALVVPVPAVPVGAPGPPVGWLLQPRPTSRPAAAADTRRCCLITGDSLRGMRDPSACPRGAWGVGRERDAHREIVDIPRRNGQILNHGWAARACVRDARVPRAAPRRVG